MREENVILKIDAVDFLEIQRIFGRMTMLIGVVTAARDATNTYITEEDGKYENSKFSLSVRILEDGSWAIEYHVDGKIAIQAHGRNFEVVASKWIDQAQPKWWARNWPEMVQVFTAFNRPKGYVEGPYDTKNDGLRALLLRDVIGK